ncbi:MAG: LLM class flavin-dependent oxidoreductase [Actinobacteria bacterium]|nr:MAG: LLM class flavin-dependent oxidoreductase [Actinomycetota bacterium]
MEYALQVAGPYENVLAAARFSEERGLPALAMPDHYLMATKEEQAKTTPANDALIQLAGLARETSSLDLVALVSPVTFRHPAVLLKTAITIDHMSGGRFSLGVGTGWLGREHEVFGFDYPPMSERFAMLEEALAYLRAGLDPGYPGFSGERYRLEPFPIAPAPIGRIRLLIGGTGSRRTPYLAGTYADEYNVYPGEDMADRIGRAQAAAAEAGRDPDDLFLSSSGQVVGADTEDELEEILEQRAHASGMSREELSAFIARRNSPIATWERLREQMAALEAAGISRFYLQGGYDAEATPRLMDRLGI